MRRKTIIGIIMIFYIILLSPLYTYAAGTSLPYHRDFESDTVDTPMDDGNCSGLDEAGSSRGCYATIRDEYPARYGSQYLEMKCDYVDPDHRSDAFRVNIFFEGAWDPQLDCHEMRTNDDTEYWIGWSNYIPYDYVGEKFPHNFFQLASDDPVSIIYIMRYGADENGLPGWRSNHKYQDNSKSGSNQTLDNDWEDDKGKWTDWVLHIVWHDTDDSDARFEVFKDGVLVYSRNKADNMITGAKPILVWYNYNWAYSNALAPTDYIKQWDKPHSRAVYMDELRIYEQARDSGANDYCDACPPIVAEQPTISYPSNNKSGIPRTFTAIYDGYRDERADPQKCFSYAKTQVQIDETGGNWSTTLAYDSGEVTGNTSHSISGLDDSTNYRIRVRHKSARKGSTDVYWGPWSNIVKFTTGSGSTANPPDASDPPNPPANLKVLEP